MLRATARPFPSQMANPLFRLLALRRLEIAAQTMVLFLAVVWLEMPLAVAPMAAIIACSALINFGSRWRFGHSASVGDNAIFLQLIADTVILGLLLYFAGGPANPFVSLLLLPPTLAAAMLPVRRAWAMAGIALLAYTVLMFWSLPLPLPRRDLTLIDAMLARAGGGLGEHAAHSSSFALHVLGMWLNFVVSIGVVAFFLTRMATALRERERQLATAREAVLHNEQILSLGTLAAGAAHQLGTPLATMAVLLREIELSHGGDEALQGDLRVLREQVDRCKQTISQILASAGQARDESLGAVALDIYLQHLLDDWQLIRPRVALRVDLNGSRPAPVIAADRTLAQALLNLLDNAADANGNRPETVAFTAGWDAEVCRIEILDHGPGLRGDAASRLGEAFFTTKAGDGQQAGGVGIGLFLSNATIQRFGGMVELFNRDTGGVCTRVTLPLVGLKGL